MLKFLFQKMWSTLQLLCLALAVYVVQGRPDGAPSEACHTLHPGHAGQAQQYTPLPYSLLLDVTEPYIDDKVTLTIKGKTPEDKIAGFLVQAREKCETPIGTFSTSDNVKTIDCLGGTQVSTDRMYLKPRNINRFNAYTLGNNFISLYIQLGYSCFLLF